MCVKYETIEAQRLRLSQDAEQLNPTDDGSQEPIRFSYIKYDEQSRIVEVGEASGSSFLSEVEQLEENIDKLNQLDWPTAADATLVDQTYTTHDDGETLAEFTQENLRSRVAMTYNDDIKTYYSYDVHGNVKTLAHEITSINALPGVTDPVRQVIDYDYDLISGNVKEVAYQRGQIDQFLHRYDYDADNRLTDVYTSEDNTIWEHDARYFYYLHGPLARVEVGHDHVQGMDYYYTLQGWIKGVNLHTLDDPDLDPGMDGAPTLNANGLFARDEMAYMLGYHNQDYKAINNTGFTTQSENLFGGDILGNVLGDGLYNGNIAAMATTIPKFDDAGMQVGSELQGMSYQYDQLHRIKSAKAHSFSGSTWALKTQNGIESFASAYDYDGNGNIQELFRNDIETSRNILSYIYNEDKPNQLDRVEDDGAGKSGRRFEYDNIGNIISNTHLTRPEIAETKIEWTVYGKVESVLHSDGSTVTYTYDAAGNRLSKQDADQTRYYIRDASGNVMATYLLKDSELYENEVSLYGSSRLGQRTFAPGERTIGLDADYSKLSRLRGDRFYEQSNHLGNVLTVVSDQKYFDNSTSSYKATVKSAQDYYPFGLEMSERTMTDASYRYAFNGKEKDTDGLGDQTHYDYGFRIYNPEIARFLSVDPLTSAYSHYTPYQFAGNKPIAAIDLDGLEEKIVIYFVNTDNEIVGVSVTIDEDINLIIDNKVHAITKVFLVPLTPEGRPRYDLQYQTRSFTELALSSDNPLTPSAYFNYIDQDPDRKGIYDAESIKSGASVGDLIKRDMLAPDYYDNAANVIEGLLIAGGAAPGLFKSFKRIRGGRVLENVDMPPLTGRAAKVAKHRTGWASSSANLAIQRFAPGAKPTYTATGKILYKNNKTGIQVVYDIEYNYFRIQNTLYKGNVNKSYLNLNGKALPNNVTKPNGKQRGRTKPEFEEATHYNNTDKIGG